LNRIGLLLIVVLGLPGLLIACTVILGLVFEMVSRLRTPPAYRFLYLPIPFPPLKEKGQRMIVRAWDSTQAALDLDADSLDVELYMEALRDFQEKGDKDSWRAVLSKRLLLRRRYRTGGK
jgi:hypothetical protein